MNKREAHTRPLCDAVDGPSVRTRPRELNRASGLLKVFAVECEKTDGSWLTFSRYSTKAEAESVRDCLVGLGQATRITVAS